jgi:hypothetical protein
MSKKSKKVDFPSNITYLGSIPYSNYLKLSAFKHELTGRNFYEKIPLLTAGDKKAVKEFIEDLIRTGSDLEQFFSYAKASEWNFDVVEELIDCYWIWVLGCASLIKSNYGTFEKLRIHYPTLADDGGVSGVFATVLNETRLTDELTPDGKTIGVHDGPRITNKGTRGGVSDSRYPEKGTISNEEGITQCKSAHASVGRKIEALSEILRSHFSHDKDSTDFYIIKDGDDFKYEGRTLADISKETDYYATFDALYCLLPGGGIVTYINLGNEVKGRLKKLTRISKADLIKFLQRNLTDNSNGFLRYAKIVNSIAGGKKLIRANRGKKGIEFNNRKGG